MSLPLAAGTAGTRAAPVRPAVAAAWPTRPGVVIAVAALLGLGLPILQLTRSGYLTGFVSHFGLIALPSSFLGVGNVPPGGLYVRNA